MLKQGSLRSLDKDVLGYMKVVPVGDHVVVRRFETKEIPQHELVLPNEANERPAEGRVLSVGDGRRLAGGDWAQPRVGEGDRVLYHQRAGTEMMIGGEKVLILNEDEILAVLG